MRRHFGFTGAFSLRSLKNLSVAGEGGVMTTNSPELYHRLVLLGNHGLKNRDEIHFFGYNFCLDTIQARGAAYHLQSLEEVSHRRQKNAELYDRLLADLDDEVVIPPRGRDVKQVFHTDVIQVEGREQLIEYLRGRRIATRIHYPIPSHPRTPGSAMGWKSGASPGTGNQASRILRLPIHQFLTEAHLHQVAASMKKF